jgi:phage recombination protein Bet
MTAVAIRPAGALTRDNGRLVKLFTQTVGKELRGAEVDEALVWCEVYGANPFVKDIYFFVFDADKPDKRRVVPVLGIGLYRKIAARAKDYRPDDKPPRVTYGETGPLNPAGIVSCEVTVYRYAHGGWHPITSSLKWEERAPIAEIWREDPQTGKRKPSGQFQLDPKKTNWRSMPETMLAKCVEADALRKGWPDALSGSYVPEEMDAAKSLELTATEIVAKQDATERLDRIGMAGSILVDWSDGTPLEPVPVGKLGDRSLAFIEQHRAEQPSTILAWWDKNVHAFREYWGRDKDGCLTVKTAVEEVRASLVEQAA